MGNDIIQARYEQLAAVAQRFGQQAQAQATVDESVQRGVEALQAGGWEGRGAAAFFKEMNGQLKWRAMLEGSEALRPDLADANAAYRHFLDGDGGDRTFSYERFVENDSNGQTTLRNLIVDAQRHAEVIGQGRSQFSMTSDAYAAGGGDARFPYPATENWQKTIGAHSVWTSADVQVTGTAPNRTYSMTVVVHAEDRYNFNPGAADIATGIPDGDNGIFEITGLAHQYMNYGQLTRVVTWREGDSAHAQVVDMDTSRNRRPGDNRRARNRL